MEQRNYIGGSHITCCMYEHCNKQLIRSSLVNKKVETNGSKNAILETWSSAIQETISKAEKSFLGIGFAMPRSF